MHLRWICFYPALGYCPTIRVQIEWIEWGYRFVQSHVVLLLDFNFPVSGISKHKILPKFGTFKANGCGEPNPYSVFNKLSIFALFLLWDLYSQIHCLLEAKTKGMNRPALSPWRLLLPEVKKWRLGDSLLSKKRSLWIFIHIHYLKKINIES